MSRFGVEGFACLLQLAHGRVANPIYIHLRRGGIVQQERIAGQAMKSSLTVGPLSDPEGPSSWHDHAQGMIDWLPRRSNSITFQIRPSSPKSSVQCLKWDVRDRDTDARVSALES